jgi:hypothetical protein
MEILVPGVDDSRRKIIPGRQAIDMPDPAEPAETDQRVPLDTLVTRMRDPTFASRHRREHSMRDTSAHVNPVMLAVSSRDSLYVRSWRDHARRCEPCRGLYRYFGLPL